MNVERHLILQTVVLPPSAEWSPPVQDWVVMRVGEGVAAGRIVTTGTYTALHFAKPGQVATATFHGFGAVSVELAA